MVFSGIPLRPILQDDINLMRKINLKNTLVKLLPQPPGANELIAQETYCKTPCISHIKSENFNISRYV